MNTRNIKKRVKSLLHKIKYKKQGKNLEKYAKVSEELRELRSKDFEGKFMKL